MAEFIGDREHLLPSGVKRKTAKLDKMSAAHGKKRKAAPSNEEHVNGKIDQPVSAKKAKTDEWSVEQKLSLLQRVESQIPSDDINSFKTRISKLDWDKVKFERYTSDECKEHFTELLSVVRKHRTLQELCKDAEDLVKNPQVKGKKQTHPDMPKKPLTPYFKYYMDKRKKTMEDNPEMSAPEISQLVAQQYKILSEKKKSKYVKKYGDEMKDYQKLIEKFRQDHPEFAVGNSSSRKSTDPVRKPTTPVQAYLNTKRDHLMKTNSELSKREAEESLKAQWKGLTEKKKLLYIRSALDDFKRYAKELAEYQKSHADYQPKVTKSVLTKEEQKILDRALGKPEKPPASGYSLFCSILMHNDLSHIPSQERMAECSKRWKTLSQQEKNAYQERCIQNKQKYAEKYDQYLESLPEEERENLKREEKLKQTKSHSNDLAKAPCPDRPKRPISALFIYCNEKREKFQKSNPQLTSTEVNRTLVQKYNQLSEKKKERYKKKEEEYKADYEKQMQQFVKEHPEYLKEATSQKKKNQIRKQYAETPKTAQDLWIESKTEEYIQKNRVTIDAARQALKLQWEKLDKADKIPWDKQAAKLKKQFDKQIEVDEKILSQEPKKPPANGYALYSQEMLQSNELKHLVSKSRVQEIGRRWKMMPDQEKKKYKLRRDKMFKKYEDLREKFLQNLTTEEKKRYDELSANKANKRSRKLATKKSAAVKKDDDSGSESDSESESGTEEESESGSESESEEESASSSGSESEGEAENAVAVKPKGQGQQSATHESASESESESESEESSSESESEEEEEQPKQTTTKSKPQAKAVAAPKKRQGKQAESSSESESESSGETESESDSDSGSSSESDSSSGEE